MENKIKTDVANALIEALWLKGFLSDAEREKVKNDIAKAFTLKKFVQTTGRMEKSAV